MALINIDGRIKKTLRLDKSTVDCKSDYTHLTFNPSYYKGFSANIEL
jgi:hypothetical protein